MIKTLKIAVLLLLFAGFGNIGFAQVKGPSGLKWYSWNASGGFMAPVDPFKTDLGNGIEHGYRFSGTPGFTFSLAKPLTIAFNLGAELEDHRIDGDLDYGDPDLVNPLYNTRFRTYSLFGQYYLFPNTNINHFLMAKIGYSGVNMARGGKDLSRTIPADLWEWVITGGYGITYHMDPNFSVNLYGEFSPVRNRYLTRLFSDVERKNLPMARIVLSLTVHTDIRVFFPFSKARRFTTQYKPEMYMPFYKERKRKKN